MLSGPIMSQTTLICDEFGALEGYFPFLVKL